MRLILCASIWLRRTSLPTLEGSLSAGHYAHIIGRMNHETLILPKKIPEKARSPVGYTSQSRGPVKKGANSRSRRDHEDEETLCGRMCLCLDL